MTRLVQLANNATSTLASGITNSATSITLATGTGSRFPTLSGGQYFMATLINAAGTQLEVVKVTARSGDVLTVTRAQEAIAGTAATAYAFATGDKIEARLTAGLLTSEIDRLDAQTFNVTVDTFTGAGSAGPFTLSGSPGSKQNTSVFVGGVYQEKSTYTLSGTSLTLGDPAATGVIVEVAYGTPLAIGTPADGTVTTAKIADNAVTAAKVASDVATTAGAQTLSAKTLVDPIITGTITEDIFALTDGATVDIDPGNGSIQTLTLAGTARTLTYTNMVNGEAVTLMINDGTSGTITTWNATFVNNGAAAPTLSTTAYTVVVVWKVGGVVYAAVVGNA